MAREVVKIPPAKSLMTSLRSIGYNFSTALADIIDNSISAHAKNIQILTNSQEDNAYVIIFDDGDGMNYDELGNAMTLGSDRDFKPDSELELGRFGLGLKSASFSQCLKLTVVSKKENIINASSYDLRTIQTRNEWILNELTEDEISQLPEINNLYNVQSGTMVIWQEFDHIKEGSKKFTDSFVSTISQAVKHTSLVFHRFYDEVNIEFDHHKVNKVDPFLSTFQGRSTEGRTLKLSVDNENITVVPYVLPYQDTLTNEEKNALGNPKSIYDEQGFYIYRNKRLIVWGSWLRMNVRSELNKLARIKVDIPSSLDNLWNLDVKKSSAKIPDKIKDQLEIAIKDAVIKSKKELKYPGKKESEVKMPVWVRVDLRNGESQYEINKDNNPLYHKMVESINDDNQRKLFDALIKQIEECFPKGMIASDNAEAIKILNSENRLEEDELVEQIIEFAKASPNPEMTATLFLEMQGYRKVEYRKNEILERIKNG